MGRTSRLKYRHLRRTLIAVPAAVAFFTLLVVGLRFALESAPVQETARRWIISKIESATGFEVTIRRLRWSLLLPSVEVEEVRVLGGGIQADVNAARIELGGIRILERELRIDSVSLSGVRVEAIGIPKQRRSQGSSWLRLWVGHLDARDVEMVGRELPGRLSVEVSDLDATWSMIDGPPRGFLRIGRARVEAPGIEPVDLALGARFRNEDAFKVERFSVYSDGFKLDGSGLITRQGTPTMRAHGQLDLEELDRVVRARAGLKGRVSLDIVLDGNLSQPLTARVMGDRVQASGFPVARIRGAVRVGADGVVGTLEHGIFHGGNVHGEYRLDGLGPPFRQYVSLEGQQMDLAGLLTNLGVPPGDLSAQVDVDGELRWLGRRVPQGSGSARALLTPGEGALPVSGQVQARLESRGVIQFGSQDLTIGTSSLSWQGPLTLGRWEPAWAVRARPAVLEEIGPLVNTWLGSEIIPPTLAGTGDLQISFAGPWSHLRVGLRLDAFPLEYPPMLFDRATVDAEIADGVFALESALFQVAEGDGRVSGRIAWNAPDDEQIDLSIRSQDIPLDRVAEWIDLPPTVSGEGSFTGRLRGSLRAPRGSWALGLSDVVAAGTRIGDGSAVIALENGRFLARDVSFTEGLKGSGWWHVFGHELGCDLSWDQLPLGALGETVVALIGEEADARIEGRWPLDAAPIGRVEIRGQGLEVALVGREDSVDASFVVEGVGRASLELQGDLEDGWVGDGRVELEVAQEVVARLLPEVDIPLSGGGAARVALSIPLSEPPRMEGELEVLDLILDDRPIRLVEPARFSVSEEGFHLDGLLLRILEDELFMRWTAFADGRLEGNFSGTLDALLARFLIPEWEPSGKVSGIVELLGTMDQPRLEGIAELTQLSFRLPGSRQVVSGVTGTMLLSADEAVLEGLDFRFMNGLGRCSGTLRPRERTVELALDGTIERLTVPLFPGLEPRLAGVWRLQGLGDELELSGDLAIEHAGLRRNEDLATILVDWFNQPETPALERGLALDLHIEADRTLEARTPVLRLLGSASLDITGTTIRPGLVGKIDFQEGGEITFLGARYELERGSVTFSDPTTIDPYVDFQLRAWVESYQVMVGLTGTFDRMVPSFASDPPLPEAEIFSLMTIGRRNETADGRAVGMGLASAFINRELNAELERRARELLPIDQVRVDPFSEAATGSPTARITMVKQVSPRWTVVVQGNLSTNREEVVVSRWHLSRGLFLEATRDLDGSYAIDVKIRRRY
ncbi:MAG: hypothetical protein GY906_07590 [bacterium]|nr:hypothetical protein [bacterium]